MKMPKSLRVLMIEDSEDDAVLLMRALKKSGYEPTALRVEAAQDMSVALLNQPWDIILCDYHLPEFSGMDAIALLKKINLDIPIIVVSGAIGEETALDCIHRGAHDYIMKGNLARLGLAIARELEKKDLRIKQKQVEEALRESEEKFRVLTESSPTAILLFQNDKWVYANSAATEITGYTGPELQAMNFWDFVHPDDKQMIQERGRKRQKDEAVTNRYEFKITCKDGTVKWVDLSGATIVIDGSPAGIISVLDITGRKRIEEALRQSEERYRTILDEMEEGYQEVDLAGNFTFFNKPFLRIFGYSRDEMMGTNFSRYAAEEEIGKKVYRAYNQMYKTGIPLRNFEWDVARKDGARRTLEFYASLLRDSNDRPTGFRGIVRDITERRRAEKELQKSEQRYRLLVENANEAIMVIQDGTVKFVNEKAVETFGYSMQELQTTPIFELVHPDDREQVMKKYLEKIQGDTNPTQHTYRSLHKSGQNQWVENNSVMIEWEGRPATLNLITNITERKEMEKERQENLNQLRKSLGATIDAMAATVETRDPYTAGHQRRVADLARAIATEMNLESNRIDGLRMASKIHDIGKISVPSEILTKPTKLTNLELELIKTHSASGYNVLKDIDFPWPIARMVLEHHERMDGSGYPNGLKGEQILLESRILAVADVVEAISSNRPYRASYGINAGLEEVSKHKGTTYDAVVVDACLKLFQEKGYKITN